MPDDKNDDEGYFVTPSGDRINRGEWRRGFVKRIQEHLLIGSKDKSGAPFVLADVAIDELTTTIAYIMRQHPAAATTQGLVGVATDVAAGIVARVHAFQTTDETARLRGDTPSTMAVFSDGKPVREEDAPEIAAFSERARNEARAREAANGDV